MNNILRFVIVLFLVNLAAASILAGVYNVTKPHIERQEQLFKDNALKEAMPEEIGDRFEVVEKGEGKKYWKAFKNNKLSGYVFIAEKYGYSSDIETMVGVKKDGTITGMKVINQNETPGLGAKITKTSFIEQFKGMNVRDVKLSEDGIHAITGATISSKAVVDSIKSEDLEILNVE